MLEEALGKGSALAGSLRMNGEGEAGPMPSTTERPDLPCLLSTSCLGPSELWGLASDGGGTRIPLRVEPRGGCYPDTRRRLSKLAAAS